jgi:tetratricopeptide (TPR) repeat protein
MRRRSPKPLDPLDELGLRPDYNRIFVSSKMFGGAFREERLAAARAVESLPEFRAWYWERDARAGPSSSRDLCVRTARTSDGLILLLGDELTDITRNEFTAAHEAGVPCFIFLDERMTRNAAADAFVKAEWAWAVTQLFASADELEKRVRLALIGFARNNWRHQLLEYRARRAEAARHEHEGMAATDAPTPASASYEEMQLEVVGDDGTSRSVAAIVQEAREEAAKGLHRRVYEELWDLAEWAREIGLARVALDLLTEIRALVGERLDAEQLAWIGNSEGICLGRLGRNAEAETRYLEMKATGENLGDDAIIATALQNLAGCALDADDLTRAAEFSRASLSLKLKIEDYYGMTQVISNLAVAAIANGDLEWADDLLAFVAEITAEFKDPGLLSSLEGNLGNACAKRGEFEEARAHFRRALELARHSNDFGRVCNAMINVARVEADLGHPDKALRWHRKGIELAETVGDPDYLHSHSIGAALAAMKLDRADQAATHFEVARQTAAAMGNSAAWAGATADLAATEVSSDPARAEAHLEEALAAFTVAGERDWQMRILRNWAVLHRNQRDPVRAVEKLAVALALLPSDAHDERAEILALMADAALAAGAHGRAIRLVEQQLDAQRKGGLKGAALAWEIAGAAATLSDAGAELASIPLWRESIRRYQRADDKQLLFHVRNDFANSLVELRQIAVALREMDKCRALASELASPALALQTEMNRAEALRRDGRLDEAIQIAEEGLAAIPSASDELRKDVELRENEAKTLGNLALALSDAGRFSEAEAAVERALAGARALGRRDLQADAVRVLGHLAYAVGRYAKAARLFERSAKWRGASANGERIDDLAAVVSSWSAAGGTANFDEYVQRLVDAAQSSGEELLAAERLCDASRAWLRADLERAADLYAVAILLAFAHGQRQAALEAALVKAATDDASESVADQKTEDETADDETLDPLFAAIVRIFATSAVHSRMESPEIFTNLKKELPRALSRQHRGAGKWMKTLVEAAWEAAATVSVDPED